MRARPLIYLAGPMSGLPNFNHDAFNAAARALRATGAQVCNPAENGLPANAPWEQHMRRDLRAMLLCDLIVLLPGWENSRGANLEVQIARALGIKIIPLAEFTPESCAAGAGAGAGA